MTKWYLVMVALTLPLIAGCGIFKDPSTGPTFEIVGNSGPVTVDYDTFEPGDYNTGDEDNCSGCGDDLKGDLCSFPSCTDVPDSICIQNGGQKECQPCENCIPSE